MFGELVAAYLSSGAGISGVQPKIMVPGRVSIPTPSLIVKARSPDYPHLAVVRNGDAHLKNFGVLYRSPSEVWLAPMFDVVTTVIYKYTQYPGGPELEDRTLALKLFAGKHSKSYPSLQQLHDFGRRVCGISRPDHVLAAIARAMRDTLIEAKRDERVPRDFLATMGAAWENGLVYGA